MLVELSGRVGEHKLKRRQVAVDLENDAEGALPGLASRLRGKPIGGEPIEVDYTLAGRALLPELAGKQVHLHVTIKEVREKKVPALDDEMAKDTGEAETLEGLRAKVRERLLEGDERRIKSEMTARADQGAGEAQRLRRSRPRWSTGTRSCWSTGPSSS